jgi:hypothetical protein
LSSVIIEHKGAELSRGIWENSQKLLYALLITHLPDAGRDFKKRYHGFSGISGTFQKSL